MGVEMEKKELEKLLEKLSLEEKAGQLVQLMGNFYESDVEHVLTGPGQRPRADGRKYTSCRFNSRYLRGRDAEKDSG